MIAELIHEEDYDLDEAVSNSKHSAPQFQRQTSSKAKWNTQSRYRRTKSGSSGAHRRRQHRNMI